MSIFKKWFHAEKNQPYTLEGCKGAQHIAGKYGYTLTCPEDDVTKTVSTDKNCLNAQQIASKYGFTIVCPE